jgi:phosphoglycolate phosphatase
MGSRKIKGVIFDLDGTLLDTLDDITIAGNSVLAKLGIEGISKDLYRSFVGEGTAELFRKILGYRNSLDEDKVKLCVKLMREEYPKVYLNNTKPYDGIVELLDYLQNKGIKMAVLSNKNHEFTQRLVSQLLGKWNFIEVLGVKNDEDRKPNPKLAIEISRKMSLEPEEICFIGDSPTDIETAKNAGMLSIGVTWGFRSLEEIQKSLPDYIFNSPREIIEFFEKEGRDAYLRENISFLPKEDFFNRIS